MLGCTDADPGALYREAASMPPEQAQKRCVQIDDPALQGECLTFTAAHALSEGDASLAADICGLIQDELWLDECMFLLADRRKRLRAEAAQDCAAAGRFEDNCLSHALERDFKMLPDTARQAGAEDALLVELVDMSEHYGSGDAQATGELLLAHIIARRIGPGALQMRACGKASDVVCQQGFLIALSVPDRGTDAQAACQLPRTAGSVASAGMRPWSEDAQEAAAAALDVLCQVVERGENPGLLGALLGGTPAVPMGTHFRLPPPWRRGVLQVPWDDGI